MSITAKTKYGQFSFFQNDIIGNAINSGLFWDEHLKPWMDRLEPGDVFVDVGANIGFFAIYCAKFKEAKVHAFEPSLEVFDLLHKNVLDNKLEDKIDIYNLPLYDHETSLQINPDWTEWAKLPDGRIDYNLHNNSGGLSLVPGKDKVYNFVARTLDSFGLKKVNLIKMDAQGSEYPILVGAKRTIEKCRPVVCFEYEPPRKNIVSMDKYREYFKALDYEVKVIGGDGESWIDNVAVPLG